MPGSSLNHTASGWPFLDPDNYIEAAAAFSSELATKLDAAGYTPPGSVTDTGWITLDVAAGYTVSTALQLRRINGVCYLRGVLVRDAGGLNTASPETIATIPPGYRPSAFVYAPLSAAATTVGYAQPGVQIAPSGALQLARVGGPSSTATQPTFRINASWPV